MSAQVGDKGPGTGSGDHVTPSEGSRWTKRLPWARSLRLRLLAATLVALIIALSLAGLLLAGLFRDHVLSQFSRSLTAQLNQVTARLEFDAAGQPMLDAQTLSDPRWSRPYSGLYWQVDAARGEPRRGVLRSRSLWDATLTVEADALADGEVHVHESAGPDGARLLLVERTVKSDTSEAAPWRVAGRGRPARHHRRGCAFQRRARHVTGRAAGSAVRGGRCAGACGPGPAS